jgi:hypothetical protein
MWYQLPILAFFFLASLAHGVWVELGAEKKLNEEEAHWRSPVAMWITSALYGTIGYLIILFALSSFSMDLFPKVDLGPAPVILNLVICWGGNFLGMMIAKFGRWRYQRHEASRPHVNVLIVEVGDQPKAIGEGRDERRLLQSQHPDQREY